MLLFDFIAAKSPDREQVARDRACALSLSAPFLGAAHLVCAAAAMSGAAGEGLAPNPLLFHLPLGAILVLDMLLCFAAAGERRRKRAPHLFVRWAGLHLLFTSLLWCVAIQANASGGGEGSVFVEAALVGGAGAAIAGYFTVPLLLALSCLATLGAFALLGSNQSLLAIGGGFSAALACLSLLRTRQGIATGFRQFEADWQAQKARRFVGDFEQSGRGWFWETNAEGALTYVSAPLAEHLGQSCEALTGVRLKELLEVEASEGDGRTQSLDFHLSARFPFADVTVRAAGGGATCWALSGSPNFDHFGRFLGFRGLGTNITERQRSEAEISKLARYDSLTGLPNRSMMRSTLTEALANADRRRKGCALMLIDLDRFKQVNDSLGHPVGDALLRQVAQRLSEVMGEEGQVGRLGGDEFEAILPGLDEEVRLAKLSERLISKVSEPYWIEGHRVSISASVGIAIARPGRALAESLIKEADLALYAAKAAGKQTHRFFEPGMHAEAAERTILESDLRGALAKGQLKLLFQPIVDAVTEEPVAFETLLSWAHPTRGLLPSSRFVPIAEEAGLVDAIGEWVLRTACAEAAHWPEHVRVAVNISPVQFANPALVAVVTSALASAGLDPDRLELEIGEGVLEGENQAAERVFEALKSSGVRVALDDFGTGRFSLEHFRRAPLDKIKIDRSFVRGAADPRSRNAALVRAIVTLAESLKMDTTAEGAESAEELALVRSLGCSQVQGPVFAEPVAAGEARALACASKGGREHAPEFSRAPRHRLIRVGTLRSEGKALAVRLRNISVGGAMLECDRVLAPGSKVVLDLVEAGQLDAEVRWAKDGQLGLQFREPFDLQKLGRSARAEPAAKMLSPQYLKTSEPAMRSPSRRRGAI